MLRFVFLILLFLCVSINCSSFRSLKKNPSVEELFRYASRLKERAYYKESLTYFKQLKSRFLYSRLAKEADLAIADIYFAQEEWEKSARAYKNFFELYPQHSKNDYALFYLSLSYFYQLPVTEDRDLSLSKKALFYINKHLRFFPKSVYGDQTKEKKQEVLQLIARKQWMIARFHIKQGKPSSALPYMVKLMKEYYFLLPKVAGQVRTDEQALEKKKKENTPSTADLPSLKNLKKQIQEIRQNSSIWGKG